MAATTFNIPDISNTPQPVTLNTNGRAAAADSKPMVLATEDKAVFDAINTNTGAAANALTDVTDVNNSLKIAFYYNGVAVDPTAAGAVIGGTAAGADIAFSPVTTGGRVALAPQTPLAAGKVTDAWFDPLGRSVTTPFPIDIQASQQAVISNSTSPVNIVTAGASGKKRHILVLAITNESTTTDSLVTISDGTQTRYWWAKAGMTVGVPLPSGVVWKATTAATAWTATTAVSNAANIRFDTTYAEI